MAPVKELSETEKQIFEKISNNDITGLKNLTSKLQKADIFDENGMTPLQHAAYKGNKEMVQLLLDQGANVNSSQHIHSYTALHFAALSGNIEVCRMLLLAGAKSHVTNSVGRTASQMAAFVGNHACVATINNFIPKSDIDCYTVTQGQKEPTLKPFLADAFHKFTTQINVNPVRIAINLQKSCVLLDHLNEIRNVLELMRTREMTRGMETNEIMAFKFHYLAYIVDEIAKARDRNVKRDDSASSDKKDDSEEKRKDGETIEMFIRKLLKTNKDGNMDYMHRFITECVREFPFRECTIFRQMVSSLAGPDPPFALSVVSAAINGQRGFASTVVICNTCGEENPPKKCSKCKEVQYCDRECQRLHWFLHKKACARSTTTIKKDDKQIPDAETLSTQIQNLLINNSGSA